MMMKVVLNINALGLAFCLYLDNIGFQPMNLSLLACCIHLYFYFTP